MSQLGPKVNIRKLQIMKNEGQRAVYITAYDYPFALYAERAGVDIILVGDSVGMTTYGHTTTLPVTMDEMISHAKAVTRAAKRPFVIGDMPYMSYQPSDRDAVINAGRFIAEAGCDGVKLEGGKRMASRVRAIVDSGIVVQGHIGLTPQSTAQFGGYRVQGKTRAESEVLVEDALALQEAGASSILVEATPPETGAMIRDKLSIPIYGIGAGDRVDGQLVIIHDILGLFEQFRPKFIKRYLEGGDLISDAVKRYAEDVRTGKFPGPEQFYEKSALEWEPKVSMNEVNLLDLYPRSKRPIDERAKHITEEHRKIARQFGKEFFDGDRLYGYGGFSYHPRFWEATVGRFRDYYKLAENSSILDVGCAKGFMLHDFKRLMPKTTVAGIDISKYAIDNAIETVKPYLRVGNAVSLPYPDKSFDLVISINTVHNLPLKECKQALREIQRVCRGHAFITVDAWRNEVERQRMLSWNLTALSYMHVDDWKKLFDEVGYTGDYYWFIAESA
jgi:3-methyl-2-oxobutanoate hydroxymethyltransferase